MMFSLKAWGVLSLLFIAQAHGLASIGGGYGYACCTAVAPPCAYGYMQSSDPCRAGENCKDNTVCCDYKYCRPMFSVPSVPSDPPLLWEAVCPQDGIRCPDGSSPGRDPANNCEFPACPEGEYCPQDPKVCPDGSWVYQIRNANGDCVYTPCDDSQSSSGLSSYWPGDWPVTSPPVAPWTDGDCRDNPNWTDAEAPGSIPPYLRCFQLSIYEVDSYCNGQNAFSDAWMRNCPQACKASCSLFGTAPIFNPFFPPGGGDWLPPPDYIPPSGGDGNIGCCQAIATCPFGYTESFNNNPCQASEGANCYEESMCCSTTYCRLSTNPSTLPWTGSWTDCRDNPNWLAPSSSLRCSDLGYDSSGNFNIIEYCEYSSDQWLQNCPQSCMKCGTNSQIKPYFPPIGGGDIGGGLIGPIVCPQDLKQCPDYSYVSRDGNNNCLFKPCPDEPCPVCLMDYEPVCGSDGSTYSNACEMTVKACETSKTIYKIRDGRCEDETDLTPCAYCNFKATCPFGTTGSSNPCQPGEANCIKESNICCDTTYCRSSAGIGGGLIVCPQDLKQCPDYSYVSRDENNNCLFKPCPSESDSCAGLSSTQCGYTNGCVYNDGVCSTGFYEGSYVCNTHSCDWNEFKEGIDWGYLSFNGDCKLCSVACDNLFGCTGFECGSGYCSYWKDGACAEQDVKYNDIVTCRSTSEAAPICPQDVKQCPDNSYVSRDGNNNCLFKPCPDIGGGLIVCPQGVKRCPDNSYVSRDENNNCLFKPCPDLTSCAQCNFKATCPFGTTGSSNPCQPGEANCIKESNICCDTTYCRSSADIGGGLIVCPQGVKKCPDNSYVSRDENNNCQFKPCPDIGGGLIVCPQDIKQCPDYSYVSRDENNNCQFKPCPDTPTVAPIITTDTPTVAPTITTDACVDYPGWLDKDNFVCDDYNGCFDSRQYARDGVSALDACCTCGGGTGYSAVGVGWCRPSCPDVNAETCRTNGIYKDGMSEDECRSFCDLGGEGCLGFAISALGNGSTDKRCYVHSETIYPNDAPPGWTSFVQPKIDIAQASGDEGVMCYLKDVITAPPNIVDLVVTTPELSTLAIAVSSAMLVDTLSGPGPFTVFAPTNDAFAKVDQATMDYLLDTANLAALVNVLTYHVAGGATYLSNGLKIKTVQGSEVEVTKTGNGVFINTAKVTTADIPASNGVVHLIDAVLLSSMPNIVDLAVATPDLSTLAIAVSNAMLVDTLSGPGPFTVFAPTDDAFAKVDQATMVYLLDTANVDALVNVLTYHVAAGAVYAGDLRGGQKIETVQGSEVEVTITGKGVFINTAKVTTADIPASNGVVHLIDAVLIPKPDEETSICDGLKKTKCKKLDGCQYSSKKCIPDTCDGLNEKKCDKKSWCVYSNNLCETAEAEAPSPCVGLKKKKCNKADGCEYTDKCVEK